jgi:hypothetical protein
VLLMKVVAMELVVVVQVEEEGEEEEEEMEERMPFVLCLPPRLPPLDPAVGNYRRQAAAGGG